ncbi:serine/threonine-protein kinase [Streptomyces sp. NBC_00582]|uniref:serine/threonine-protein kinase n=1 Tax=Streptomyces sp. NBC_00582 TaxID=2975783 RepID=UPI002E8043DD|nr:serine/threonine-protein kinase [Streptomyces sp. NBC_00582]WUB63006.1 serine/threonine protein kinase [Streptomyces sp. NBC_00582]
MEKLGPEDPQRIGAYRLLARLGAGGMGRVYLARSDRGRTVAVKLVKPELAAREEFRARFRQEVRNAQRVGGFWTAPVLDADTEAAVPWVATGYVAGPSLQQVVSQDHGPLPERSVRILAAGLAHALTNIHAAGIVHRDLKPSNVMVTIEGPRVIDFGVARALESVSDSGLTRTGAVVGSPGFMAPEQVRGEPITPASDVFCLGSVLAYATTGALPFGGTEGGAHALMFRIAEDEPDLTGVPEGMADLVRACLRKDPAARPSLAWILERTGTGDTLVDGHSREPWLPGALVAQLGQHAVRLLEVEDPEGAPEHSGRQSYGQGAPGAVTRPSAGGPGAAPPPPAPAAVPHPAYGHTQQHPQAGYGHQAPYNPYSGDFGGTQGSSPYSPSPYGAESSVGAPPPYAPHTPHTSHDSSYDSYDDEPEPSRRSRRTTVLLTTIALVVALAAGGSVYGLMSGGGSSDDKAGPSPSRTAGTGPSDSTPSEDESSSPSPSASATGGGAIPTGYLGTWTTTIDNETGKNTRRLVIKQGKVGDAVLSLVADGDSYHCEFTAELSERPDGKGPLEIGPSTVTSGQPRSSCTPGAATEVTLLSDGRLQRINADTGEKLTYRRG